MPCNVLITGGAGNAARYTCEELVAHGYTVTLFDRLMPSQVPFPWEPKVPFVLGELTSLADCMRAVTLAQAEAIVHLGGIPYNTERQPGQPGVQRLPEDETMRTNVMGTYYIMDAARRLGVRKVVAASTFYVLGLGFRISDKPFQVDYLPIDEEHPLRPEDTYSLSKMMDEEILAAFNRAYGIQGVAFRYMGIEMPHRPVHKYNITPEAKPGWVGGPKGTTWQYVDARDVAQAARLAIEAQGLEGFEAFYLSTASVLTEETAVAVARLYPDLAEMAKNLKGHEGIISIKKAQQKLGYQPKYSWRDQETKPS
jgi:nucleoside-diphosphate-sugar epimerase